MGTIKTKGYAQKTISADLTEYDIAFKAKETSNDKCIKKIQEECEKFLEEIKKIGIEMKDVHLEDDNLSEEYENRNERRITYKCAERRISFKSQFNMDLSNNIQEIIANNNLNVRYSTSYIISNVDEVHKELLKQAVLNSKQKAEIIAEANNQVIKGIENVSDESYDEQLILEKGSYGLSNARCVNMLSSEISAKERTETEEIYVTWIVE